jgi:hypothetical protein
MENIDLIGNGVGVGAVCKTSCGHTFCLPCFTKCVLRKNSCPMCRAEIIDNNEYTQNYSEYTQNYSDTIDSYITSYGYITSYDSTETRQVFLPSLEDVDNNLLNQELNDVYPSEMDSMLSSSLPDDITNIVDIFESWNTE